MALGAQRRDIVRMVLHSGMLAVGLGVAVGGAGSLVLAPLLGSLLFQVTATDWPTFIVVAALSLPGGLCRLLHSRSQGKPRGSDGGIAI